MSEAHEPAPGTGAEGRGPFQSLTHLSVDYAACFAKGDDDAARSAADEVLGRSSNLLNALPRWSLARTSPAFTAADKDGTVHESEPTNWPETLWPAAHQLWVEASDVAIMGKQFVATDGQRYLSYHVVAIQAELLAFLDRVNRQAVIEFAPEVARLRGALEHARREFRTLAGTNARLQYLRGLGFGLVLLSPLSVGPIVLHSSTPNPNNLIADAAACAIAGAAGALISVLTRLSGEGLPLDYRFGERMLRLLGFARPVIGSVLALAVYWAVVGGLVPLDPPLDPNTRFAFFIAIGFLAGFSERYAQDLLFVRGAEPGGPGTGDKKRDAAARDKTGDKKGDTPTGDQTGDAAGGDRTGNPPSTQPLTA